MDQLIRELSEAAEEAIERAAAEAAKAAALDGLEREAEALRKAQQWKLEAKRLKQSQTKNYFITGVICFLGGLTAGILTTNNR